MTSTKGRDYEVVTPAAMGMGADKARRDNIQSIYNKGEDERETAKCVRRT